MWLYEIHYKRFNDDNTYLVEWSADSENDAEYEFVQVNGSDCVYVTYIEQIG